MKKLIIFLIIISYPFQSISEELGVISLMYHRVGEGKYPSTNVSIEMFKQHLKAIEESGLKFIEPSKFKKLIFVIIIKKYRLLYKIIVRLMHVKDIK